MKIKLIKINIANSNRSSFAYSDDKISVSRGDYIVINGERGQELAKVESNYFELDDKKIFKSLDKIERIANDKDISKSKKNNKDAKKALSDAKRIAKEQNLEIILLNAYFTLDRSHLLFNFTADNRVDFRELAKKLASIYKTRIELRQIGVRDKAKEVGGIGPCGRFLCCNSFLTDFESVSINMAKNQFISLKPDKINGVCGRLLCCLNYEDKQYTEMKKDYPKINSKIKYNGSEGKVIAINVLNNTITLELEDKSIVYMNAGEYESNK